MESSNELPFISDVRLVQRIVKSLQKTSSLEGKEELVAAIALEVGRAYEDYISWMKFLNGELEVKIEGENIVLYESEE